MRRQGWLCSLVVVVLVLSTPVLGWTEVQPGDTITKDTLARAEALLTPATRWMVERGMPLPIIATKTVAWPTAYKEATQKYAKQVKLAANGSALSDYVAGCPFPTIDPNDPLAGAKIMWNVAQKPYDNFGTEYAYSLVNSAGLVTRTLLNRARWMAWTGRLYLEPKPLALHTPPLQSTMLLGPLKSHDDDDTGGMVLHMRYWAPDQPDDYYLYSRVTRRVYRTSSINPRDTMGGSGTDLELWGGFNAKLSLWTFRVLAEKEILAVVHSGKYGTASAWCAARDGTQGILAALPCVTWEKRKVWVVEGVPTASRPPGPYAKQILYIDQQFFGVVLSELYNQQGEFLKFVLPCFFYATGPYENYPTRPVEGGRYHYEDEWPFMPTVVILDVQESYATLLEAPPSATWAGELQYEWYFNENTPSNTLDVHAISHLRSQF